MKNNLLLTDILDELNNIPEWYARYHMEHTLELLSPQEQSILADIFESFIKSLPPNLTDEEKAVLLYEVITRETHYDHCEEHERRYVFVSALLSRQAVCMGIAELYALLCSWAGLDCKLVIGYAWNNDTQEGSLHAWNMIKLTKNGEAKWYHCDATWDLEDWNGKGHEFLLKSDTYMKEHHHFWLSDRYPPCPENVESILILNEEGVKLTCHILKKAIACALDRKKSS